MPCWYIAASVSSFALGKKKNSYVSNGTFLNELLLLWYPTSPSWQDQDLVRGRVACQYCFSDTSRWICMEVVKVNDCSLTHMLLVSAKEKWWQENDRNYRRQVGFGEQRVDLHCLKWFCCLLKEVEKMGGQLLSVVGCFGYPAPAGIRPGSEAEFRRDSAMLKVP